MMPLYYLTVSSMQQQWFYSIFSFWDYKDFLVLQEKKVCFLFSMPKWKTGFTQHLWIAGFVGPLAYCCGHVGGAECWETSIVNGAEVFADSCNDTSKYISWDGTHYTEAANKWVANLILDGSLSDPPIPLTKACHKTDSPNWSIQPSSSSFCMSS